jgi:signal peptidase I
MTKSILTIFALLFALTSIAQTDETTDWTQADGSLEGFVVGKRYFTFVSDANLRQKSNTQAAVVAKLPIATELEILAVSTDSFTQRGVKLPWVQVRSIKDKQSGYIWGGFLALASIKTPTDEYTPNAGVQYLTGVSGYNDQKHEINVQVRIAKDNKELAKCEFVTSGDLSYYPEFAVSFEPFQKVKAVLTVNYYYPACGYPSGNNLLFWQDDDLLAKVLETSSVSDGGVYYSSEEFILPTHRGGVGDHVIVTKDNSMFKEQGDDLVRTKQSVSITLFKWSGKKLVKFKEMK